MIRLGIIGTGRIARRFVETVQKTQGVTTVCVYNPHDGRAREFALSHGIPDYSQELETLIGMTDAVYIASPHETHYDYGKILLEHRRHVLCEKPMVLKRCQAEKLFGLARENGCVLMEALKTACCPGFLAMMDMAVSGKIGQIKDVESCFSRLTPPGMREMTDRFYGGSMIEFGSYVLLPVMRLLGTDYRSVEFKSMLADNGIDLYTKMFLEYEDGMGLGKTGLGVKSEGQLVIAGTEGYILAQSPWWLTSRFEVRFEDPNQREVYNYRFEDTGLQYELETFVQAVNRQDGIEPKSKIYTGLREEESIAMAGVMEAFLKQQSTVRNR